MAEQPVIRTRHSTPLAGDLSTVESFSSSVRLERRGDSENLLTLTPAAAAAAMSVAWRRL